MLIDSAIFRKPDHLDACAISSIHADGLATGNAAFRETPYDWESYSETYMTGRGLALVAEINNSVIAWAGISPASERVAYRGVGEVSIYVAGASQGSGIGGRLLASIIATSEDRGYWTLVAQIFPENEASLKLHLGLGFEVVGTRSKLGKMSYGPYAGQWRDVVMLERRSSIIV